MFGDASKLAASTTAATPATGGFTFGASGDKNQATKLPTTPNLSFGATNFQVPGTSAPTLSFGAPANPTPNLSATFNLAKTATTTTPAISLSAPTTSFGASSGLLTSTAGTNFGSNVSSAPLFGAASTAGTTFGGFGASASTGTTLATSLGATATTASTGLNLGAAAPSFGVSTATSSTFAPIVSSSVSTASSLPGFQFGGSSAPATTTATGLSLGLATSQAPKSTFSLTPSVPASGTTSTAITAPTQIPSLTYDQLEDSVNKWTVELEEQGKQFLLQARQLNAWDRLLKQNGERMDSLKNEIEIVKSEQQQLDQELDFIVAQQKELEELIAPLESELASTPAPQDQERYRIYQLAETMDSQMKQMSEDLKGIIEHLNESNKEEELNDPVSQISRILNVHMNSLQWIDRNTAQISSHLEQISKMQDINRRDSFIDALN